MTESEADFPRGNCKIHLFEASASDGAPAVMFFPDAFGPRPQSFAVAEALAEQGWRVAMPDLFYELAPYDPIEPKSIFEQGPKHDALMAMFGSITQEKIDEDVAALIAFCADRYGASVKLGATGYCMGGRYALTAACSSESVRFAAAIHGSNLAPEGQDGPHRRFAAAKGRIYVGVAQIDPTYGAEEHGRLAEALRATDTDHTIETYAGAAHGFVFPDLPVYQQAGAEKHLRRLIEGMTETFSA